MAHGFELVKEQPGVFQAMLTGGERVFLARTAADVIDLLGAHSNPPNPEAETEEPVEPEPVELQSPLAQLLNSVTVDQAIEVPQDPAVLRLLPEASSDKEVAQEFRRFTDGDLRQTKVRRMLGLCELLLAVPAHQDEEEHFPLTVPLAQASDVAGALTDMRLVMAQRLEVDTDNDAQEISDLAERLMTRAEQEELGDEEYHRFVLATLFTLSGFLVETLSQCLLDDLRLKKGNS